MQTEFPRVYVHFLKTNETLWSQSHLQECRLFVIGSHRCLPRGHRHRSFQHSNPSWMFPSRRTWTERDLQQNRAFNDVRHQLALVQQNVFRTFFWNAVRTGYASHYIDVRFLSRPFRRIIAWPRRMHFAYINSPGLQWSGFLSQKEVVILAEMLPAVVKLVSKACELLETMLGFFVL